jgi:hypothetical protein
MNFSDRRNTIEQLGAIFITAANPIVYHESSSAGSDISSPSNSSTRLSWKHVDLLAWRRGCTSIKDFTILSTSSCGKYAPVIFVLSICIAALNDSVGVDGGILTSRRSGVKTVCRSLQLVSGYELEQGLRLMNLIDH